MGLTFVKKKPPADAGQGTATDAPASKPTVAPKTSHMSWLKSGSSAKKAMVQEDVKAEERKAEQGKMWRFFLTPEKDTRITFLDGEVDDEGMLGCKVFNEHRVRIAGEWNNFVCTANINDEGEFDPNAPPCPICEKGDKPNFVGVLTVLDHTNHTIKNGPNAGKVITNTRKLYVMKRTTIKALTKLAAKRGNKLAGCTFDVSRTDELKPAVGDTFDFVEQFSKLSDIADKYGLKLEDVQPANYEDEIRFRSTTDLIALGVGKAQTGPGYEKGAKGLKDEL